MGKIARGSGDHHCGRASLCSVPCIVRAVAATAGSEQSGRHEQKGEAADEAQNPPLPCPTASPDTSGEKHAQQNQRWNGKHHCV